jgi:DNA-binding beta-propeller fold protein YncE
VNTSRFIVAALLAAFIGPSQVWAAGVPIETPSGRQLRPAGLSIPLGNLPVGAAETPDGKFVWVADGGVGENGLDIVALQTSARPKVVKTLPMPGLSGGIAFAQDGTAYVAGIPGVSGTDPLVTNSALGYRGDVIHVFGTGVAGSPLEMRTIDIPPPPGTLPAQDWRTKSLRAQSWPEGVSVCGDGKLCVALNLADSLAIIDLATGGIRYVAIGRYPGAVASTSDGVLTAVANTGDGTVSVIDVPSGTKLRDVDVGGPGTYPSALAFDEPHHRLFVTSANDDTLRVVDTHGWAVTQTIRLRIAGAAGATPVSARISRDGRWLLVAGAGADAIYVLNLSGEVRVRGLIPTADYPIDAFTTPTNDLLWISAKGSGVGPNVHREYIGSHVFGLAGMTKFDPSAAGLANSTRTVASVVRSPHDLGPPHGTPLRSMQRGGSFKHVFFIVKENRTYDQVLGDDPRGNGDPGLALFGGDVTPNLHALVRRFPLLDNVYADSAASVEGHQWTTSARVSDYTSRMYPANYGGRGRPYDFNLFSISRPSGPDLFDAAAAAGISYINYGEAYGGMAPIADRDLTPAMQAVMDVRRAHSDLGPPWGGCYPSVLMVGGLNFLDGTYSDIWDSTPPVASNKRAQSRFKCFATHLEQQIAAGSVPAFNYLTLPDDHTAAALASARTPRAMVAENDYALGQIVDLISHSPIWNSSLILVVEDDSQDGADHVDAHRIPALVISPWARSGVVVNQHYDLLSFVRSVEIPLGLHPLNIFDAEADPVYSAFDAQPSNAAPFDAITPRIDITERNPTSGPLALESAQLSFDQPDLVPQTILDSINWRATFGVKSTPPPPGPNGSPQLGSDSG